MSRKLFKGKEVPQENASNYPSEWKKLLGFGENLVKLAKQGEWLDVAKAENNWIEKIRDFIAKVGKEVSQQDLLVHLQKCYDINQELLNNCNHGKAAILAKVEERNMREKAAQAYRMSSGL